MKPDAWMLAATLAATWMAGVPGESAFAASPAATQPVEERKAQDSLPVSHDGLWNVLMKAKITYRNVAPYITASLPPEVKALNGKTLEISGFVLPMDGTEKTSHFLLSKRTPTCPFCPPGEPNEVVEVYARKPVPWDDNLLTMRGTFALTNNTEQGIFFVLKNAEAVTPLKQAALPPSGGTPNQPLW